METVNTAEVLGVWRTHHCISNPSEKKISFKPTGQLPNLFSAGNFYCFILNFVNLQLEQVSESVVSYLGIHSKDLTITKILHAVHPEDMQKLPELEQKAADFFYHRIPRKDISSYKVVYVMRLRNRNGIYKTILHQAKALLLSKDGKIQKLLCIHTDISHLNVQVDHRISFISYNRSSWYSLAAENEFRLLNESCNELFTREKSAIIEKIAEGKDFHIIADELYLSPHTVNTHKKNILHKAYCKNIAELIARCVREGVI